MALNSKSMKQNVKWALSTENLIDTNAKEKSHGGTVHSSENFHKDNKSPKRMVASPHRFKTQIIKISNDRETKDCGVIAHRRGVNGVQTSKSLSAGEIECLRCKSNHGIKRLNNSQSAKSVEFSSNGNSLKSSSFGRRRMFLNSKSDLTRRSATQRDDIKERLEQLRKNTNRLLRKSIERKIMREQKTSRTNELCKHQGLEKNCKQNDDLTKELNTLQPKTQSVKLIPTKSEPEWIKNHKMSKIKPLKSIEKPSISKRSSECFEITTMGPNIDTNSIGQAPISDARLNFHIRKEEYSKERFTCLGRTSCASPVVQSQNQQIEFMAKCENEKLSQCEAEIISVGKESQCLTDKRIEQLTPLSLEIPSVYLKGTAIDNSDYKFNKLNISGAKSQETNVRNHDMSFWLRPSPIQIFPYGFVLAVRRKLEYIINPHLADNENIESTNKSNEIADLQHRSSCSNAWVSENKSKNSDPSSFSKSNNFVSDVSVISGAQEKWNSLVHPICFKQLNYCATSSSSKMCAFKDALHASKASHDAEASEDEFQDDDTTISSSVFDSPKTMESTLGFDDEDILLQSLSSLPNGCIDHTKPFHEENNLSQWLIDFNQSLSEAMEVNEQLKNSSHSSCISRDDVQQADCMDSSKMPSSCQNNDDSGCENLNNWNSEPLPSHTIVKTFMNSNKEDNFINGRCQDVVQLEPIAVSPSSLPTLKLTNSTDASEKLQQEIGSSTSFEYECNQTEYCAKYVSKSQQKLANDPKIENSICELTNQLDLMQPPCFENLKPVLKKSESNTKSITQNSEAFIRTPSIRNKNKIKSETGNTLSSTTEKIETTSSFSLSKSDRPALSSLTLSANPQDVSSHTTSKSDAMSTDPFKNLLQMGEKILVDRTKSQIAWLEVLKEHYKEYGLVTHIATVKKKQRGLLLKLDQDREKMKRLLYSTRPAFNNKTNTPAGNKSSKEYKSEPFTHETKPSRRISAATRTQRVDNNIRLMGNLSGRRELVLHKRREQPEDSTDYSQRTSEEESEVIKLDRSPLNASKKQLRELGQLPTPERVVLKEKLEKHIKKYTENLLRTAHQKMKQSDTTDNMALQRQTNLQIIQDDSQITSSSDKFEQQSKNDIVKCEAEGRDAENQINKNKSDLSSAERREIGNEIESSDLCSLANEEKFNTIEDGNCPCALDVQEAPTSCTDTESMFSARQELLERKNLIECNIKKFVSMTKEVIAQHVVLRRSLSHDEISRANAIVRSDYCKTWPSGRKSTTNNRVSANNGSEQNINPKLKENNLIDDNQIIEQKPNLSDGSETSGHNNVENGKPSSPNLSKCAVNGTILLVSRTQMDATSNQSSSTTNSFSTESSKSNSFSSYLKSTYSDTEGDCLSHHCQDEKDDRNSSTTTSLANSETMPAAISANLSNYSQERASVRVLPTPSTPIDDLINPSVFSLESSESVELSLSSELEEKHELPEVMKPLIPDNAPALSKSNAQPKSNIIDTTKERRSRQPLRDSERQINKEIPNKPPPPYVSPAPGSPMTTIFPSEERIRDITFRRSHELFCELLKMDYASPKGQKLPSVMDERITNIYERIILDICKEFLNDHMDVVSQGSPADFHGPLAFFNPPDRLSCIQNAIYKEVHRCLTMNKSSPKSHQVFSIYGQRAKRDHIGKIIIQEIYDEDDHWCNFQREENEVLELMVGEMVTNQILKLTEEEWSQ